MNERRSRGGVRLISPLKRALIVALIIILGMSIYSAFNMFNNKKYEYEIKASKIDSLKDEIAREESKALKIEKSKNQITSDEEYESLAREELGLIHKDEIVIKPR